MTAIANEILVKKLQKGFIVTWLDSHMALKLFRSGELIDQIEVENVGEFHNAIENWEKFINQI